MNEKKTFLIVDDDVEDCEFFCEAVGEVNPSFECHKAHNGEDALTILKKYISRLPDYIFLDLNMPRMNGRELLQELKKDKQLQMIPVIIYTTSSSPKDKEDTKQLGAAYFLTKPAEFKTICKEIKNIITQNLG